MKITTKAVFDIATWKLLEWEGHEYAGPIEHCGGGPSPEQKAAASSQANLTNQLAGVAQQNENYTEAQRNKTTPFYGNMMENGPEYTGRMLDYAGGTNAAAYAPEKANLERSLGYSTGLPSGYRDQAIADFNERRAAGYDQNISSILADQQAAKERGAAGLMGEAQQADPLGYYGAAQGGNQSILNANLRRPGAAGIIGGVLGGAASAIPV
jgi:hypothetical protein